jgi:alkylated DNA repair dioxygenase AlkB
MSKDAQALTPLLEGSEYELLKFGDGADYVFRSKTDEMTARIQGDDALRLKADLEAISASFPAWKPDQILAQLWDQGGYGWLATKEGE